MNEADTWWEIVSALVGATHSASGLDLPRVVDDAVARLGMSAQLYLADRAQRVLTPISATGSVVSIDGTLPGRAFQLVQVMISPASGHDDDALWVPVVNGTERLGVLRLSLPPDIDARDLDLQQRCSLLGGLLGHVLATKFAYGDRLHRARRADGMTTAAELLWQLLPPSQRSSPGSTPTAACSPT